MTAAKDLRPGDRIRVSTPTHYNASTSVVDVDRVSLDQLILILSDGTRLTTAADALLDCVAARKRPLTHA